MRNKMWFLVAVVLMAVGCAPRYPVTKVNAIDSRPTLSFTNATVGAVLMVDNLKMGEVALYDGRPKVLVVEPGTHEVVIAQDEKVIFQQTVFIESEHKVINVH